MARIIIAHGIAIDVNDIALLVNRGHDYILERHSKQHGEETLTTEQGDALMEELRREFYPASTSDRPD